MLNAQELKRLTIKNLRDAADLLENGHTELAGWEQTRVRPDTYDVTVNAICQNGRIQWTGVRIPVGEVQEPAYSPTKPYIVGEYCWKGSVKYMNIKPCIGVNPVGSHYFLQWNKELQKWTES